MKNIVCGKIRILFHRFIARKSLYSMIKVMTISDPYTVFFLFRPPGRLIFQALLKGRGGGGYLRGGLIYLMLKLYDNFLPTQSNVCKVSMYFNNFNTTKRFKMFNYIVFQPFICILTILNTTLNVLRCSTICFINYQPMHVCMLRCTDVHDIYVKHLHHVKHLKLHIFV